MGKIAHLLLSGRRRALALAELGTAASAVETVFLAFLHAGIAGQVTVIAQWLEQFLIEAAKRTGYGHAYGTGLSGDAATLNASHDIDRALLANMVERFENSLLMLNARKELFERLAVDQDLAAAWTNADACNGGFTTPGTQRIAADLIFLDRYHNASNS